MTKKGDIMYNYLLNFVSDETGAVSVDWVVLTAATVGLAVIAIALLVSVNDGVGQNIGDGLKAAEVRELDFTPD